MIGGDALQAADRDRFSFDAATPAGGFARPVADATEDAGKNIGFAVDQIGVGELALRDEPDVLRHVGVRRAGPLTIDNPMVIVRISSIGRFHRYLAPYLLNTAAGRCRRGFMFDP